MRRAFLIAILSIATFGFQPILRAAPNEPPPPNMILLIDAKPEQMAAFDRALRPMIPTKKYEWYGLGCTVDYNDGEGEEGCEVMRAGNSVPDDLEYLAYYFNDQNKALLRKFEMARDKVQRQFPDQKLTMEYRHHEERQPNCSGQAAACTYAPHCPQFGSCSKQRSSCTRCY